MNGPLRALVGIVLAVVVLVCGIPRSAGAAGGGGGDGAMTPAPKPDDPDYTAGVKAIEAGKFTAAIPLMEAVIARDGTNADAYNWLAYAVRRSGNPARAIGIYEKALALDPKHRGAHEYIGEAYLVLGDVAKAKQHLAALDRICFFPCSQYRDLKKAVEAYEKSGGATKPQAAK
jgi:tetratricopeptide (TPR) repeat protein